MIQASDTIALKLDYKKQVELLEQTRKIVTSAPLVRPQTPNGMPMRVRVSAAGRFGWVGDGAYRYSSTQKNGAPWPDIPKTWLEIADKVAGKHPWDSAIINWYEEKASLGWHQDLAEKDKSLPIVTISIGDACSWAIRKEKEGPISRCRLESGDVTLLSGYTRLYFHTVERIIAAPLFSPLKSRGRISLTLRVAG